MATIITLKLTLAEARALDTLAGEGAAGLLTDEAAGRAYLGGKRGMESAERACEKLRAAVVAEARKIFSREGARA
jgi:hypothetical protein